MKKFLAILLTLVLVLVNVAALADDGGSSATDYKDLLDVKLQLPKNYIVKHGTAPAETFTFKFEAVSYVDGAGNETTAGIPAIADKTIEYSSSITTDTEKTIEIPITANDYNLGVYTYKVTEVIPETKTAGIEYESDSFYMVLTILSEGTTTKHFVCVLHEGSVEGKKTGELENTYDAGTLEVKKITTGNMADLSKKFAFTITFATDEGVQVKDAQKTAITVTPPTTEGTAGAWTEGKLEYKVNLANGETVKFSNLPQGVKYTVTEDKENYKQDKEKVEGTIAGGVDAKAEITNTLEVPVDTGISMETVPYIMILALALIGAAMMFIRKREEY